MTDLTGVFPPSEPYLLLFFFFVGLQSELFQRISTLQFHNGDETRRKNERAGS